MKKILIGIAVLIIILLGSFYFSYTSMKENRSIVFQTISSLEKYDSTFVEEKYDAIREYNEAVKAYNISVRKFPNNIYADMLGYQEAQYFTAGNKKVEVNF